MSERYEADTEEGQHFVLDHGRGGRGFCKTYTRDDAERIAALEAERDAARADAERYRWIRSDNCYWVSIQAQPYGKEIYTGGPFDALDAAIDAARGAE